MNLDIETETLEFRKSTGEFFIDKAERPIRRNPKIARMLYYSKDIESFGTGLKRIAETRELLGLADSTVKRLLKEMVEENSLGVFL